MELRGAMGWFESNNGLIDGSSTRNHAKAGQVHQ
jgi:hypothetical protein